MDYRMMFDSLFPGFFQKAGISGMPEELVYAELVMDLRKEKPREVPFIAPAGITFGEYHGRIEALREAVGEVDEDWVQYFEESTPVFCAFDRERVISFCILSDWGRHQELRIGGPGCVGTVPEYRGKGIGLELVRQATNLLREKGIDCSWIHYTYLERWYQKLGYQTALKWNSRGFTVEIQEQPGYERVQS